MGGTDTLRQRSERTVRGRRHLTATGLAANALQRQRTAAFRCSLQFAHEKPSAGLLHRSDCCECVARWTVRSDQSFRARFTHCSPAAKRDSIALAPYEMVFHTVAERVARRSLNGNPGFRCATARLGTGLDGVWRLSGSSLAEAGKGRPGWPTASRAYGSYRCSVPQHMRPQPAGGYGYCEGLSCPCPVPAGADARAVVVRNTGRSAAASPVVSMVRSALSVYVRPVGLSAGEQ